MCLIIFAFQSHPEYPLIVAANRDEFFHRPTEAANYWAEAPEILAGRDLQAGGTWLGINKSGGFSALTNFRDGNVEREFPASRGELPLCHLHQSEQLNHTIGQLYSQRDHYNGFNLLLGNSNRLAYLSNRSASPEINLKPGIYGLSNALLDTPWPKVSSAKKELNSIIQRNWKDLTARQMDLFRLLENREQAPDRELPDTGIERDKERLLSSRFISSQDYGTRAATLVIFHRSGRIHFLERQYSHRQPPTTKEFTLIAS